MRRTTLSTRLTRVKEFPLTKVSYITTIIILKSVFYSRTYIDQSRSSTSSTTSEEETTTLDKKI